MEQASFFIEKKALFGGYPNHKQVLQLQNEGVVWFVDLTAANENNLKPYSNLVKSYINYPIIDKNVPEDRKKFLVFLFALQIIVDKLKPGEKIYLHCRGGHGRSSLVVACFLSLKFKLSAAKSLSAAQECHLLRPNLRPKWRTQPPYNALQRFFVESFFGSLYLFSNFGYFASRSVGKAAFTLLGPEGLVKSLSILNFYLHQDPTLLETLLNSGLKTIIGEGATSMMLEELRFYILYSQAKKLLATSSFDTVNK